MLKITHFTLELRENWTEHTSLPSCAFGKVLKHRLLTESHSFISPSFEQEAYIVALGLYLTYIKIQIISSEINAQ